MFSFGLLIILKSTVTSLYILDFSMVCHFPYYHYGHYLSCYFRLSHWIILTTEAAAQPMKICVIYALTTRPHTRKEYIDLEPNSGDKPGWLENIARGTTILYKMKIIEEWNWNGSTIV